jgi:intracellular multiplication protein IcmJ
VKQNLPLVIAAKRGNWHRFLSRMRNKRFLEIQKNIFARDASTCQYCSLQTDKYLWVVNKDHDYSNNHANNMTTACSFCAQCFFIDCIGQNNIMGGTVIYLPEVSQADLNHFCRVLFTSMLSDVPYKGKLQSTFMSLLDRTKTVEDVFGPESSKPNTLGQALIDNSLSSEQLKHPMLKNLRILPQRKNFTSEIQYWKKTIFDQIPL